MIDHAMKSYMYNKQKYIILTYIIMVTSRSGCC